ncbi:glycosyltransferase family 39 protein [Streptococcus henryi]
MTRNPNNIPLFLYERFFFNLFGDSGLWIMMFLNTVYVNSSAYISYYISRKYFNQKIADYCFFFYVILILFSPFFLTMYTDILALPLLSVQIGLALALLRTDNLSKVAKITSLLGIVTGIAYFLRPTALVLIIAIIVCLLFYKNWKKILLAILIFVISFGLIFSGGNFIKNNQTEIQLVEGNGLSKTALVFVDLGLTFTGTDQEDMKNNLLQYIEESKRDDYNNGMFATENVLKDIKRRLADYNLLTFSAHILVKLGATVMDGSLGWTYFENLEFEKTPYISPLYEKIKDNQLLTVIRHTLITKDTRGYQILFTIEQLTWLILLYGLALSIKIYKEVEEVNFLQLTIFGGMLFLMIFEGGKTRYLIQFLPQIILLSSLGLYGRVIEDTE